MVLLFCIPGTIIHCSPSSFFTLDVLYRNGWQTMHHSLVSEDRYDTALLPVLKWFNANRGRELIESDASMSIQITYLGALRK